MESIELIERIDNGEDSNTQFKADLHNATQLAQEMVAFSNTKGGVIIVGVNDNSEIIELSSTDIGRLNQLISNAATENVRPPINPLTEIVNAAGKRLLVITIVEGINKPYCTNEGIYFAKVGSDKRKISQEELQRLFQESGKLYADQRIISASTLNDIDIELLSNFYLKEYAQELSDSELPVGKILENLGLARGEHLNLAGLLLFGREPQKALPPFIVKTVSFFGDDPTGTLYRDSEDIKGTLQGLFKEAIAFLLRNLKKIQAGQGFNTEGILEISRIALEELLVNALIHRDYLINAPIKLFVFDNRVEIENPGRLPNNLTIENIKHGVSIMRNPVLTSFASKMLPYRGIGTGIMRAIKNYPQIAFENNIDTERFKVTIHRNHFDS
ncbi:MAG: putative DNA binding domain-containing protein [Nitrospirae bacterium]|nr:putative DNA binding domain-containing protein [Nitrospirota bacterium]